MFESVLIVANPNSGHGTGVKTAEKLKAEFLRHGILDAYVLVSYEIDDTVSFFVNMKETGKSFDFAVFVGGDGTFGVCVDAMLKANIDMPVALFSQGTSNDVSCVLKTNVGAKKFVDIVLKDNIVACDVAFVHDRYVFNVACGGYFTHGANVYNKKAKKILGKIVYYLKGGFSSIGMKAQAMKFVVDDREYHADTIMFLIMNTKRAGGFNRIGVKSNMFDGLFDLCVIKKMPWFVKPFVFFKIVFGKHTNSKYVIYDKGVHFEVSCEGKQNPKFVHSDLDGNVGPSLPLDLLVLKKKVRIFCNLEVNE